jgi:hypothetical protein
MLRLVDLGSKYRYLVWGLDSDFNGVAIDHGYFNVNSIADYNPFTQLSLTELASFCSLCTGSFLWRDEVSVLFTF